MSHLSKLAYLFLCIVPWAVGHITVSPELSVQQETMRTLDRCQLKIPLLKHCRFCYISAVGTFSLSSCMNKPPRLELNQKGEARQCGKVDVLKLFPLI